jgi:hypothetical protein
MEMIAMYICSVYVCCYKSRYSLARISELSDPTSSDLTSTAVLEVPSL